MAYSIQVGVLYRTPRGSFLVKPIHSSPSLSYTIIIDNRKKNFILKLSCSLMKIGRKEYPMSKNLIAKASLTIQAPADKVWNALVDPQAIRQYMFGANAVSDWREGSPIIWKGEWQGKPYEDKGVILQLRPGWMLQYSHFSPLSGLPETAENYHTVTIELAEEGDRVRVSLSQDHNATEEEVEQSRQNWEMMLTSLKKYLEE
jgi:uncharacterized protein YndB with AHSA1/START domain